MSTHVKNKDNYFHSKEDDVNDDIDEFPSKMIPVVSLNYVIILAAQN
jgi:hypothetical protein